MVKSFRQDMKTENVEKLRDSNSKLRAKNRGLRKELKKALEYIESVRDILEDEHLDLVLAKEEETTEAQSCPRCNSSVIEIPAGKFLVYKCSKCTWKGRKI